tara:strand:+ start:19 stop:354 length:336 start_codon:yes stop_codon:yes gene_type:complete
MTSLANAKILRTQSTPMEIKLWSRLRSRRFTGLKFRRQCPLGSYIIDFICIEKMLIIEIDGGQHNEDKQQEYDKRRTEFLNGLGYNVLRFWNNEVQWKLDAVMDKIYKHVI